MQRQPVPDRLSRGLVAVVGVHADVRGWAAAQRVSGVGRGAARRRWPSRAGRSINRCATSIRAPSTAWGTSAPGRNVPSGVGLPVIRSFEKKPAMNGGRECDFKDGYSKRKVQLHQCANDARARSQVVTMHAPLRWHQATEVPSPRRP